MLFLRYENLMFTDILRTWSAPCFVTFPPTYFAGTKKNKKAIAIGKL
jgi:hypothetical protein